MGSFSLSGGVEVFGFISPSNTTDQYPVIDPLYGIDGLRNVNTLSDLNLIPTLRRRAGMLVGVSGGTTFYKLNLPPWNGTLSDWSLFELGFTGGTVTGNTIFTNGVTANTISASTYLNLPIDVFVTGGTYDNVTGTATFTNNTGGTFNISGLFTGSTDVFVTGGTYSDNTFTFTNNTGGTFNVSFNSVSGLTINGDLNVTGNTIVDGLTANTISATTYQNLPIDPDTYITAFTYNNNLLTIDDNSGNTFNVTINDFTGLTINGDLNVTGNTIVDGISVNTISATTYFNLPQDTTITGGTFLNGDLTLVNNSGGTFVVSGSAPYNAGIITNATGWTDNGDGTITLPQINVALYDNVNFIEPLRVYTIPSGTTGSGGIPSLQNNDTNYLVVEYNGGSPRYYVYDNPNVIDYSSVVLYMIIYRANNFIHLLEFGNYGAGLPNRIDNRINNISRFGWESGFSLGLSGTTGVVTLSAGVVWNGVYRQSLVGINSHDNIFFQNFDSGGTWVYVTTGNTLNNEYYDDGTNSILATAGKYLVNWYFRGQEVNSHLYEVWGNDEYDNVADAQLSVEPLLPELVSSHAFLVGRIIVQVSATTGSVESAFVRVFQSTQVTNHNDLLGLQGGIGGEYFHLSATQYNNNAYTNVDNNFSVGQTFNDGLTATTISATTYQNLPIDPNTYITAFTYSSNTLTIFDNFGSTFDTTINDFTGLTINGDLNVTGNTIVDGLTANTISATTYQNLPIDYRSFGVVVDGAGSVITMGNKGYLSLPYSGYIIGWRILGDQLGSTSIDVWKTNYIGFPPTSGDSITGGNYPNLTSQQINEDYSLLGWTTGFTSGDIISFNVLSASTTTRINLTINVIKT